MENRELFGVFQKQELFEDLCKLSDGELEQVLSEKAQLRGHTPEEGVEMAQAVRRAVEQAGAVPKEEPLDLSEFTARSRRDAALGKLMAKVGEKDAATRAEFYRQSLMGLRGCKLETAVPQTGEVSSANAEEEALRLEQEFRREVEGFNLSPAAARSLSRQLGWGLDPMLTARELARRAYARNCLCTMELCLDMEGLEIDDAARIICTQTAEMAAVGGALRAGQITMTAAQVLLTVGFFAAFCAVGYLFLGASAVGEAAGLAALAAGITALYAYLIGKVPQELGQAAVLLAQPVRQGLSKVGHWLKCVTESDSCVEDDEDWDPWPNWLF